MIAREIIVTSCSAQAAANQRVPRVRASLQANSANVSAKVARETKPGSAKL
jgi:hypothetical protein